MRLNLKLPLTIIMLALFLNITVEATLPTVTGPQQEALETSQLELSLSTDKEVYGFGSLVQIFGNLTLDGSPVEDGLVGVQVNDPVGYLLATRTLDTGTIPSDNWVIEILQVATVDSQGNPKDTFKIGQTAYIEVTMKNNLDFSRDGWITATVLDADLIPIAVPRSEGSIPPGTSKRTFSLPLSTGITLGQATIYANIYTKQPADKGMPYCPEKTSTFTITSSTQSTSNQLSPPQTTSTYGSYSFTFRIYKNYARKGNYTVSATSQYQIINLTANTTKFEVILEGDVNGDDTVDIFDLVIVGLALGSEPSDPNWDPRADINGDDLVDIFDLVIVGLDIGKTVRK